MPIDFTPYFQKYESLLKTADSVFEKMKNEYPDCVACKPGCADCCKALFDLTFIEALYINHQFNQRFETRLEEKAKLIEKANRADREVYRIKKRAYKELEEGKREEDILADLAKERVPCPLLNSEEQCDLYDHRPITCRFYGIPTAIGGQGHTCGISNFVKGEQYPTVNLDIVHKQLYEISAEVVQELRSKHIKMAELLVPLSMAMLTVYDDEYLGIANKEEADPNAQKKGEGDG